MKFVFKRYTRALSIFSFGSSEVFIKNFPYKQIESKNY